MRRRYVVSAAAPVAADEEVFGAVGNVQNPTCRPVDLGEQAHRVKFMIRDRGSNYTAVFDAVLADAGIRTLLCNV